MDYMHGIRIQENQTSVPTPVVSEAGVPVIFGTAPVNLAKDPGNAVNRLFLCNTFAEAVGSLGYSEDYANYTLCQAMDAFFKAFGIGPVVLCNVLDPESHAHTEELSETLTVTGSQAVSESLGIVLSTLAVKNGETALENGEDYTVAFNSEGKTVITLITSGIANITITGRKLKPSGVTADDVIGAYDSSTGGSTGIELVNKVYQQFSLAPSLLLAPGWSHIPSVGLALSGKCEDISGLFRCECVVDIDCGQTAGGAKKYADVEKVKRDSGYVDKHMICVWPRVKYDSKEMAFSAIYAAMASYTDYTNDNVPNLSPSNRAIGISTAILADGTEVLLDQPQANELNATGVVTALNMNGWKAWGNNTAAYPDTTDPKDRWISCRRFFSWWGNSFIVTYMSKVDNPANYRLIESIVDSENVRANSLVSMGKCAGLRMVYSKDDNPTGNVMDGKIVFRQYLAPYTPAEDIQNILEFDPDMLKSALGGE